MEEVKLPGIDHTHDPAAKSWVESADGHSEFPVQNLPFGIFSPRGQAPRAGLAIGDEILDLEALVDAGLLDATSLAHKTLNAFLAQPAVMRRAVRHRMFALLTDKAQAGVVAGMMYPASECAVHLPAAIGDYTDFYVGIHHANNIGRQYRPDNPLLPNYKYLPIGYHGRASSVRPSGIAVARPRGQQKPAGEDAPVFGMSERLDFELELGVWIGLGNPLGQPVPIAEASDHIAGLCLLNDWSARDIQGWEAQPLGPFLAKSFHTTISPWIVTAEALAPFRRAQPPRPAGDPAPLDYLLDTADQARGSFSIDLDVMLTTARMRADGAPPISLGASHPMHMYWTVAQMIAHHTSNGCGLNPGDLLGTGTISTPDDSGLGSLMELTRGGSMPLHLMNGETRRFLEDGDVIALAGHARADGFVPIGFGECRAEIGPAN